MLFLCFATRYMLLVEVPGLDISRSAPILMDPLIAAGQGMQKVQKHRNSHMPWLQGI